MTCCTFPEPHRHYPDWLRDGPITDSCKCGQHPRRWTVDALLTVWKSRSIFERKGTYRDRRHQDHNDNERPADHHHDDESTAGADSEAGDDDHHNDRTG